VTIILCKDELKVALPCVLLAIKINLTIVILQMMPPLLLDKVAPALRQNKDLPNPVIQKYRLIKILYFIPIGKCNEL